MDVNLKQEDCKELLKNFSLFNDECIVYSNIYKLEKEFQDFYNKKIRMNNDDICKLCCETIDQSQCSQWFEARRLRLSASSNIHNIKIRTRKTIDKLVNDILYPANVDSESTNYGLSEEDAARKKYEELNDCEVKKTGVIVCEKQPWLCASLNGVVIDDGCVVRLVEIKCPIKCKDKPVVQAWARGRPRSTARGERATSPRGYFFPSLPSNSLTHLSPPLGHHARRSRAFSFSLHIAYSA